MTVTSPSPSPGVQGHEVTYTFNNLGQQTQAVYRNVPGGDPQQTVTTTWSSGRPVQVDTQVGGVTRRTTTSWNNLSYPTEQEDSDWYPVNGGVIPRVKSTYSYAFLPYSGLMKPSSISVFGWENGQYVQQGLTQYSYDEYAVSGTPSNVPNKTSPVFTDRGNVTTVRQYKDGSNYVEQHLYYDDLGNLVQSVDPLGHPTSIGYADNFTSNPSFPTYAFPTTVTNALNQSATTKYDYNTGLVKYTYDLRNLQTTFSYDLLDRPLTIAEANGRSTTYTYTDSTPMVTEEVLVDAGKTRKTEIIFDKLNRPIRTQLYDPAGTVFMDTQYDGNGRAVKVSQPYRSGTPVWTETSYDVLNRPLSISNPDSTQSTFAYADNTVTTTDEAGNQRRMTSDTGGHLVKVEEPNPTLSSPLETTYSYYAFGALKQVTQGSQTRTFTYDWLGRLTQEQHPETATTSYSYYDNGLLSDRTDARNITTHYTYDNVGRPWTISYSDGTTPGITYAYDQNGFTGFLTNINVAGVTTSTLEYFASAGLLKKEAVTLNGVSGSFASEYTYDYDGRLLTAKYPSGRTVTATYDSGGGFASDRLSTIVDGPTSSTLLQSVQDNAAGLITARSLSNGLIAETRSFNARNELTRIAAAANSTTQLDLGYGYGGNNDGRIRLRTDSVQPEHSVSYTFDEIGRLKTVSGGDSSWGISWELDRYGNRTTQTPSGLAAGRVGAQTFGYADNKISGFTGLQYDPAGNLTNEGTGGHVYTYDAENRLTQIDSSAIRYEYDYAGRRIKKTVSGTTTYYFYGLTGLMSEFSTSTTISNAPVAAATDRIQYRVGEQTGTAVMLADADGTPRENNRMFPFGEPWLSFVGSDNNEKFTTYLRDDANGETGLDYAMARYYASRSGRFMTPDPGHVGANISDPQSWNAYAYSRNDPVNLTDPTGLRFQLCDTSQNCIYDYFDIDFQRYFELDPDITLLGDGIFSSIYGFIGTFKHLNIDGGAYMGFGDFLWPWMEGDLPPTIDYGPYHGATQDMARSPAVIRDRDRYIQQGCPATFPLDAGNWEAYKDTVRPVGSIPIPYGFPGGGLALPIPYGLTNATQFQVGGFGGGGARNSISKNNNGTITYTITNTAGFSSAIGWSAVMGKVNRTLGTNINRNALDLSNGYPMGNVTQTFTWSEPNPC